MQLRSKKRQPAMLIDNGQKQSRANTEPSYKLEALLSRLEARSRS